MASFEQIPQAILQKICSYDHHPRFKRVNKSWLATFNLNQLIVEKERLKLIHQISTFPQLGCCKSKYSLVFDMRNRMAIDQVDAEILQQITEHTYNLSSAIQFAESGTTLYVLNGMYSMPSHFRIHNQLTITGIGQKVVIIVQEQFSMCKSEVIFKNIKFVCQSNRESSTNSINLEDSQLWMKECHLCGVSIYLYDGSVVEMRACSFKQRASLKILENSVGEFVDCVFSNMWSGIKAIGTVSISGCIFENNHALMDGQCNKLHLQNNLLKGYNIHGIDTFQSINKLSI